MMMYKIQQTITSLLLAKNIVLNNPFKRQLQDGQQYTLFIGDMIETYTPIKMGNRIQSELSIDIVSVCTDEQLNDSTLQDVITVMNSDELKVTLIEEQVNVSSIHHESTERVISDDSTELYESKRCVFKLTYTFINNNNKE
ncbi:hypothetical protein [Candidatus Symbiopectobacterium sp. NZEC135]|uniref:hypothetical protein n=1 Tax=Candidatus Symbiopectobacterium sp. NZEC135 TaxID=2820471 RepID=UPI00222626DB|nr:hypothetical protein [Candidatus Symbiopectobacterium sp. NZEC135]MCW2478122.1 hypothetical protein [Candidatus Symbiopectobacterium sp. NZEC135]